MAEQRFLDDHDSNQHEQRERSWSHVRRKNAVNRPERDADGREQQHRGDNCCRDRFGFPMTVRMILIFGCSGDDQTAPHDHRTEDIGQRLDRIRNQGVRMAENAGGEFASRKNNVGQQTEERGSQSTVQSIRPHSGNRTPPRRRTEAWNWRCPTELDIICRCALEETGIAHESARTSATEFPLASR